MSSFSAIRKVDSLTREDTAYTFDITIAPTPRSAHYARRDIAEFISKFFPCSEAADEFMLAVGEVLANAVEHSKSSTSIIATAIIRNGTVTVSVRDNGSGFQARTTSWSVHPASDCERGRGFPIISQCTDKFAINSYPDIGTCVTLSRDLSHGRRRVKTVLNSCSA